MNTLKECFNIILNGDKDNSRLAARRVRKLLYGSHSHKDKFKDIEKIIDCAPFEYSKILEDWRQENFVVAISVIYYLHDREENVDFLFVWLFELLQHPNGIIRYASARMLINELGPLTAYLRIPGYKSDRLSQNQADIILETLFISLIKLLDIFWEPKYKKYKYIASLPSCPYKSAQMVLARLGEMCGKGYMKKLEDRLMA